MMTVFKGSFRSISTSVTNFEKLRTLATKFNHSCLKKITIYALKCFPSIILLYTYKTARKSILMYKQNSLLCVIKWFILKVFFQKIHISSHHNCCSYCKNASMSNYSHKNLILKWLFRIVPDFCIVYSC